MKITLSYCNESTYVSGSRPLFGAEQRRATLAVDRIALMLGKPTRGALVVHPSGPDQHLHHPHKQADTDDHHHDREQSSRRSGKRDVAEPGRGQCCDRKIKRIDIVTDRRVMLMLRFINDRRHHKEEHEEVDSRDNRIVIASYEREVVLHAARDAIGAKQAKRPERAKEAEPCPLTGARNEMMTATSARPSGWSRSWNRRRLSDSRARNSPSTISPMAASMSSREGLPATNEVSAKKT